MRDVRKACDGGPGCHHKVCHVCERRIRHSNQRKDEHPGTILGHIRNRLCDRCMVQGNDPDQSPPQPTPGPAPDPLTGYEGHILLPDKDMQRIKRGYPGMHAWHMRRRRRLNASKTTKPAFEGAQP